MSYAWFFLAIFISATRISKNYSLIVRCQRKGLEDVRFLQVGNLSVSFLNASFRLHIYFWLNLEIFE